MNRRGTVIVVVLATLGVAVLLAAVLLVGSSDDSSSAAAVTAPDAIDRVIPAPGDEVLQQQRVGVVLGPRYRLTSMVIYPNDRFTGGINVTAEVAEVSGLNLFEFVPGENRLLESLSPDTNCARASYVLIARPSEPGGTVEWCFEVV